MAHPSEGVLQAFIDGEIAADERARVSAHLEQCADCRAEIEQLAVASSAFAGAVAVLGAQPDLSRARAAIQARAADNRPRVLRLIPREPARATAIRRAFLRAAVLVLIAAGAVSAAVPGSPVRRFFVNLWQQTSRLFVASRPAPPHVTVRPAAPVVEPAPAPPAGVSVLPLKGEVVIQLHDPAPGLRLHVRVVDSDRASVEASGRAASARFRTAPGRIEVTGGGTGDLRVGIPRATTHAAIDVDGRPLFSKLGDRLRPLAPAETASGESVFQLNP